MTEIVFENILRSIKLPLGKICEDNSTYLLDSIDFQKISGFENDLKDFDRLLVLSDGKENVVGGILFYDRFDIQALMLEEYRGKGYFSAIHKNGVLKKYLYERQEVTLSIDFIDSAEDVKMKRHLLSLIGLEEKNKKEVNNWIDYINKIRNRKI